MTDHEQQYDPQLQWVIDEVIFAITQQKQTDAVWCDVNERNTGSTADEAWDEEQQQQLTEAKGEALFEKESSIE